MCGLPIRKVRLVDLRNLNEQINTLKQNIDMLGLQHELPVLCGHQTVFQRVRDPYGRFETDDACCPLE